MHTLVYLIGYARFDCDRNQYDTFSTYIFIAFVHLFAQLHSISRAFVHSLPLAFGESSPNSVVTLFPASVEREPFSQIFGPCLKGCVLHGLLLCV